MVELLFYLIFYFFFYLCKSKNMYQYSGIVCCCSLSLFPFSTPQRTHKRKAMLEVVGEPPPFPPGPPAKKAHQQVCYKCGKVGHHPASCEMTFEFRKCEVHDKVRSEKNLFLDPHLGYMRCLPSSQCKAEAPKQQHQQVPTMMMYPPPPPHQMTYPPQPPQPMMYCMPYNGYPMMPYDPTQPFPMMQYVTMVPFPNQDQLFE